MGTIVSYPAEIKRKSVEMRMADVSVKEIKNKHRFKYRLDEYGNFHRLTD